MILSLWFRLIQIHAAPVTPPAARQQLSLHRQAAPRAATDFVGRSERFKKRYKLVRPIPSTCAVRTLFPLHISSTRCMCTLRTSSSGSGLHTVAAEEECRRERCKCSGKSPTSMKSEFAVIAALAITFSSSRTLPGQSCCSNTMCARRVNPWDGCPYVSPYFFTKCCTRIGMSPGRSAKPGTRSSMLLSRQEKDLRENAPPALPRANRDLSPQSTARPPCALPAKPRTVSRGSVSLATISPASAAKSRQSHPETPSRHLHIRIIPAAFPSRP